MLFDTTVLIAHLRGEVAATEFIAETPRTARRMSVMSRVEVEGGMRSAERSAVGRLFASLELVPVSDQVAGLAAQFVRTYRRSHSGIHVVDYVIAATAKLLGEPLATLNVKHFPMFEGLKPPW